MFRGPSSAMDPDRVSDGPAPVVYIPPPMEVIRQNALRLQSRGNDAVAPKPEDTNARVRHPPHDRSGSQLTSYE
jgi:hypothetical protein